MAATAGGILLAVLVLALLAAGIVLFRVEDFDGGSRLLGGTLLAVDLFIVFGIIVVAVN